MLIALALACEPRLLIADEPTTALDVMVQAQVLDLLAELQARAGLAMIFITHDLSVLTYAAERLAVMYAGRIVEEGPSAGVRGAAAPVHPGAGRGVPDDRRPGSRMAPRGLAGDRPDPAACRRVPVPPAVRRGRSTSAPRPTSSCGRRGPRAARAACVHGAPGSAGGVC